MHHLMTVAERIRISKGMQADLVKAAEGSLLLLPYVHLVPPTDTETEVQCGPVEVELRASAKQVMHASGRVLETDLPFHVHCRVLVVDAHLDDVPERTEVWLKE
jgi:hypothetical protein